MEGSSGGGIEDKNTNITSLIDSNKYGKPRQEDSAGDGDKPSRWSVDSGVFVSTAASSSSANHQPVAPDQKAGQSDVSAFYFISDWVDVILKGRASYHVNSNGLI